jgi:hypothetical protein
VALLPAEAELILLFLREKSDGDTELFLDRTIELALDLGVPGLGDFATELLLDLGVIELDLDLVLGIEFATELLLDLVTSCINLSSAPGSSMLSDMRESTWIGEEREDARRSTSSRISCCEV